jgi:hypothetical protein
MPPAATEFDTVARVASRPKGIGDRAGGRLAQFQVESSPAA